VKPVVEVTTTIAPVVETTKTTVEKATEPVTGLLPVLP